MADVGEPSIDVRWVGGGHARVHHVVPGVLRHPQTCDAVSPGVAIFTDTGHGRRGRNPTLFISTDNEFVFGAGRQVASAGNVALAQLELVRKDPRRKGPSTLFNIKFTNCSLHNEPHIPTECERYSLVIEAMCTLADLCNTLFGRQHSNLIFNNIMSYFGTIV